MPIPDHKTWLKETDLGFGKIRSLELVQLDREIDSYNRFPGWTNAYDVSEALHNWRDYTQTTERNKKGAVDRLRSTFDFIYDISQLDPTFTWEHSPLGPLLEVMELDGKVKKGHELDFQRRLDSLVAPSALQYIEHLKAILALNPSYCYVRVSSGDLTEVASSAPVNISTLLSTSKISRSVRYTSALAKIDIAVVTISAPGVKHEVGFIQHCIAKSDVSTYSDGSKMQDAPTVSMPVGDSILGHEPWYFRGHSVGRPQPTHRKLKNLAPGEYRYYMDDGFANNFHPYHPRTPTGMIESATLTSIVRKQSFIAWLVHKMPDGEYRLLVSFEYTINVNVQIAAGMVQSFTSTVSDRKVTRLLRAGIRPRVSAESLNNASVWKYQAPNAAWVNTTVRLA